MPQVADRTTRSALQHHGFVFFDELFSKHFTAAAFTGPPHIGSQYEVLRHKRCQFALVAAPPRAPASEVLAC
jgi:hypothetical protein